MIIRDAVHFLEDQIYPDIIYILAADPVLSQYTHASEKVCLRILRGLANTIPALILSGAKPRAKKGQPWTLLARDENQEVPRNEEQDGRRRQSWRACRRCRGPTTSPVRKDQDVDVRRLSVTNSLPGTREIMLNICEYDIAGTPRNFDRSSYCLGGSGTNRRRTRQFLVSSSSRTPFDDEVEQQRPQMLRETRSHKPVLHETTSYKQIFSKIPLHDQARLDSMV